MLLAQRPPTMKISFAASWVLNEVEWCEGLDMISCSSWTGWNGGNSQWYNRGFRHQCKQEGTLGLIHLGF